MSMGLPVSKKELSQICLLEFYYAKQCKSLRGQDLRLSFSSLNLKVARKADGGSNSKRLS
jgi:hypothetical protein